MTALAFAVLAAPLQADLLVGLGPLGDLSLLPRLRTGYKIGAVTSYDRTEGNDDGFSGKYSFVAKEGDDLVLADLKGPGCITRIHTPTPTMDKLEFFFDGEAAPRVSMPYRHYFDGEHAPFLRPLVDIAGGGCMSYVPMFYAKSCKVVLRAPRTQFYDINFVQFPAGTAVTTFDPRAVPAEEMKRASQTLGRVGLASEGGTKIPVKATVLPGKATTVFQTKKGGRIKGFALQPASSFVGKGRDVQIRITWDGEASPSILMPVGDFFGFAWGRPAMRSAVLGTVGDTLYCNFPMPYARSAKIELVSTRTDGAGFPVTGEVVVDDRPLGKDEGRFYAHWNRENPTTPGRPFTWLERSGRGHIVGLSLQAQDQEPGLPVFFEGDDKTIVDGIEAVHGTGSEDFFNGGWYALPGRWERMFSLPLSGCLGYYDYLGRTGGFRFLLNDAYTFEKGIVQTIEHGPEKNQVPTDYVGVAYYYADSPPHGTRTVASPEARRVVDPKTVVYAANWAMPIATFGLSGCTVKRGDVPVGNGGVRVLSLRSSGANGFVDSHFGLRADVPVAGRYRVSIDAVRNSEGGTVRLSNGTRFIGEAVDFYAATAAEAKGVLMGEFDADEGENVVYFQMVGKHAESKAFGLDLGYVRFERITP
ncbi:MAG: DUF2961 domain-containing protein [Armatimonadetes bacterium]|nr:DUF2961 domain-containing protein [Armatimonadota bacterium]